MIYLFVIVTFFGSVGREPFVVALRAPSAEACEAKAVEVRANANKDTEVQGYSVTCITVPTKS